MSLDPHSLFNATRTLQNLVCSIGMGMTLMRGIATGDWILSLAGTAFFVALVCNFVMARACLRWVVAGSLGVTAIVDPEEKVQIVVVVPSEGASR